MAIQSMTLDPNGTSYTDNEIVGKVNAASVNITRAASVAAAARPIAAGEIGATEIATGAVIEVKLGTGAVTEAKVGTGAIVDSKIAAGAIKTKLGAETDGNKLTTSSLAAAAGVTNAQVAAGLGKASLDAMADTARGYIKTSPATGEFVVVSLERQADGKAKLTYDDVAIP